MPDAPSRKTLYLIDATAQLFRAYFALPGLTNEQGLPTHAVYGFTTMLRKLLKEEQPPFVAAAFDVGGEVFRHQAYAEYKANRPPAPEDLNVQVPYAKQVCEALGVRVLERKGYEADDLIASYARRAREAGYEVVVVAADKDLLQLVGRGVCLLNPTKNQRFDAEEVTRQFGVPPERVRDVLAMMGDAVDNIPGVPGVGEKTALAIVSTHGELERVLARAERFVALFDARDALLDAMAILASGEPDAVSANRERARAFATALDGFLDEESDPAFGERMEAVRGAVERAGGALERGGAARELARELRELKRELKAMERGSARRAWYAIHEHAEQACLSRELATLRDDLPVDPPPEKLFRGTPDPARVNALYRALGFRSLTADLPASEEAAATEAAAPPVERGTPADVAELDRVVERLRAAKRLALACVADGDDALAARLLGIGLAAREGHEDWVRLADGGGDAEAGLPLGVVAERLGPLLADPSLLKLGHDAKRQEHLLRRHGLPVAGWQLDTRVAAFLLDPGRGDLSLEQLATAHLPEAAPRLPLEAASGVPLAAAELTLRLAERLEPLLEQAGLRELYDTIDGPLLPVLVRMEAWGIRIDVELLGEMSRTMEAALARSRGEIHELAGMEFNVDSPKQLREVLFERLGLKPRRRTAKGRVASTDAQTLEELAGEHAIARKILEHRELSKLKGTYVDALPRLIRGETGRVHTSFHPTGAATGRLSSSDPNLQNIPVRTAAGRKIRSAFVPADGYRFLASDYSQVELRVLAHLAQDAELIAAFQAGEDIHRYTASKVFDVTREQVTPTMRRRAKAVNFGILYGMSETRLAREQGMTRGEARAFIAGYFERFSGVRHYIDEVRERARRDAAVRTLFGRVRYFPQLHQQVHRGVQEQALRAAVNTTIQGTAADLMKLAMLRVDGELERHALDARILLQVHDELLLEVRADVVERVRGLVRDAMEAVHRLAVPLIVDQKVGESWLEVT